MSRHIFARRVLSFILPAVVVAQVWAAQAPKLVAAVSSDRYHVSTCKIAQKIHPDDLIVFKTPEEAWAADLMPCKKCNPPVPKGKEHLQKTNFGPRQTYAEEES